VDASAVASGSSSTSSRATRDGKRGSAGSSSGGPGGAAAPPKKVKPKHLSRKIAALAGSSAEQPASQEAAGDAPAGASRAPMRELRQQQQQLQAEKLRAQADWKDLVQLKLKQTLARKASVARGELERMLRKDAKEKARARKAKDKDKATGGEGAAGEPTGSQEAARNSALKALQARLARLEPEGWDQLAFDSKLQQLTAQGLSRGVLLREIGVDEEGGAKGSAAAVAVSTELKRSGKPQKRLLQDSEESCGTGNDASVGTSAGAGAGAGGNSKKRRLEEGTVTKEKFLKIQAKKAKKHISKANTGSGSGSGKGCLTDYK